MSFNWHNIRPLEKSQQNAFEELVCQLAKKESNSSFKEFVRKGRPDAGVECFWKLENDEEWCWQAKFFTSSFENTQWRDIDDSVKQTLSKHPDLKKYVVGFPIDPPDARLKNQTSLLEKWNQKVIEWTMLAKSQGREIVFEAWWSSDLISRLQKPENTGMFYFWFNKEEFSDDWFSRQNQYSIDDLGPRYTPELNIELEASNIFNALDRNDLFKQWYLSSFEKILKAAKKIKRDSNIQTKIDCIVRRLVENYKSVIDFDFASDKSLHFEDINKSLDEIIQILSELYEYYSDLEGKESNSKQTSRFERKYSWETGKIIDAEAAIKEFLRLQRAAFCELTNCPYLLIYGEAGIGKSHLLADAIIRRNSETYNSIFLLGQHFVADNNAWEQISRKLELRCSIDEFLGALNAKAESQKKRIIFFIDAINEGKGKLFWDKEVVSFVRRIKSYTWLGLVISIRTSYLELIAPKDKFPSGYIHRFRHSGFLDHEYEAIKVFFKYYKIELPAVPSLHFEFQNPLFLKLFCEGLYKRGLTRVPEGLEGITAIFNFYIESVNSILANPSRFSFPRSIKVVKRLLNLLVEEMVSTGSRNVPYEKAFGLAESVMSQFSNIKGFLDHLVSEGVLSRNIFWTDDGEPIEAVYISYERHEDHLLASMVLDKVVIKNDLKSFNELPHVLPCEVSPGGILYHFLKDSYSLYSNKGFVEALAVQLPEKCGVEIFEILPKFASHEVFKESFLQSFNWRSRATVTAKVDKHIEGYVFAGNNNEEVEKFFDILIGLGLIPNHYLNADYLHIFLNSYSMADRDTWWIPFLRYKLESHNSTKRLIDWSWNQSHLEVIEPQSQLLAGTCLAWFLASTNRRLRDISTKALVNLYRNRILQLIPLLDKFKEVDDTYIRERLYCAAYGAVVKTNVVNHHKDLIEFSTYVFDSVFLTPEFVIPHILLRDYARGIVEYVNSLEKLSLDLEKIRPPYNSPKIPPFPSSELIEESYKITFDNEKRHLWSIDSILSSMHPDVKKGMYGDFGRYVFQNAFRTWRVDIEGLSNLAIDMIFKKFGFNAENHGLFDIQIGSGRGRRYSEVERIGKKYQWMAFYELLALVSDHYQKYTDNYSKVVVEKFDGPWNPYVRDIDPTIDIKESELLDSKKLEIFWWDQKHIVSKEKLNNQWLKIADDFPNVASHLIAQDKDGEEWIVLQGYPEWKEVVSPIEWEEDKGSRKIWLQIRSYLIAKEEISEFAKWSKKQNFMGRWMPESSPIYQVFNREYYWANAYNYHDENSKWIDVNKNDEDDGLDFEVKFKDDPPSMILNKTAKKKNCKKNNPLKVMTTALEYLWEEEYDYSKPTESALTLLKPNKLIFEGLGLKYGEREGEWINSANELICFDPSAYSDTAPYLLVKRKPFEDFLVMNGLKLAWTVIGEKNVIGETSLYSKKDFPGWKELSGFYILNDGRPVGDFKTKNQKQLQ